MSTGLTEGIQASGYGRQRQGWRQIGPKCMIHEDASLYLVVLFRDII